MIYNVVFSIVLMIDIYCIIIPTIRLNLVGIHPEMIQYALLYIFTKFHAYITLLETSLFTRVVYPQYMVQLIVWYFSSFSVNLHSLMFY